MRILGIDPGSIITGYGIIDMDGNQPRFVDAGCIRSGKGDFPARLRVIHNEINNLVVHQTPNEVAIEQVFLSRNADSALKLGQARAAAICGTFARDQNDEQLALFEYAAREVKQAVVGKGGAAKEQVQHMVKVILSLRETPQPDAADALAVALCHGFNRIARQRIAQVTKSS
ncbi:MAG TPA: crossover junction endodeoxyribonuclease RuvC [Gammaproteobacteria bacterium]|nr:crossover junction endodeoxyribonuclease RuvC [Gammaproteobacteria bacterium]